MKTAKQMGRELTKHDEERLHELNSEKVERFLDSGHGACYMNDDRIAKIVTDTLGHFDKVRFDLIAYCVMPNHVHVVVRPRAGHRLPEILHSWKSFSAKAANQVLNREGQFWQKEYYDHLIRDEADFVHCVEYTLANPQAVGLQGWKWVHCAHGTGVPPVTGHNSTGVPPVTGHNSTGVPPAERHAAEHGQDAHATSAA